MVEIYDHKILGNKAGYTTTPVACKWDMDHNWGQWSILDRSSKNRRTDGPTKRGVESRSGFTTLLVGLSIFKVIQFNVEPTFKSKYDSAILLNIITKVGNNHFQQTDRNGHIISKPILKGITIPLIMKFAFTAFLYT